MKYFLLTLFTAWVSITTEAQGTESFTNLPTATPASYISRTWTGDNGLQWTATDSRGDQTINGIAAAIRNGSVTCSNIPNGIGNLSFQYQQAFTTTGGVLEVRVNGNLVNTLNVTTNVETASVNNINVAGNFSLEIKQTTTGVRVKIDDVTWSNYNGAACTTPTAQPTTLVFDSVKSTALYGSFAAASPVADQYLVIMSTSSTLSATPQNGTLYDVDDVVGGGIVIAKSSATAFTKANLAPGTTYYFFIYALNNACSGGPLYNLTAPLTGSSTTTAPAACAAPTAAPGPLTLVPASTSINGSFNDGTGADGYLVVRSNSSTFSFSPANGTSYSVGQTVGTGSNGVVVSNGPGNTFTATGLTPTTQYYFSVYSVAGFTCSGGPLYFGTASEASSTTTTAQSTGVPPGYYDSAVNKTCATLKTALKVITSRMSAKSYDALWTQYKKTDVKPNENGTGLQIWDIYSDNPNGTDPYSFVPGTNECGSYNSEGDCYNREHSFPQNWFGGGTSAGPGTDYHHIFPTDGKVNGLRSNYIYGEVATPTTTTMNGSKLGPSAIAGFTGNVFEPINEFKGDLARAFLYMVTRYESNIPSWGNISGSSGLQALDPSTFPSVDIPYLQLMLKWHHMDPVSTKEIDRNNGAYVYQGNRNPYIDHPEYADYVWNNTCPGLSALPVDIIFFQGKLNGDRVKLEWQVENEIRFDRYEVERSFNGETFSKIGEVTASGARNYSFNDNVDAARGKRIYYRLKKVDRDGKFKYSEIFSLQIPLNTKFSVYPNPAGPVIQLQLNNSVNGIVSVQITDLTGKVVKQNSFVVNGTTVRVSTDGMTSGSYLVKFNYNGEQYLQKVMVVK